MSAAGARIAATGTVRRRDMPGVFGVALPTLRSGDGDVRLGEAVPLRLVLPPAVLGAPALPVARDRERLARDAAVDEQMPAHLAHRGRLAVDERLDLAVEPLGLRQRVEQAAGAHPRHI